MADFNEEDYLDKLLNSVENGSEENNSDQNTIEENYINEQENLEKEDMPVKTESNIVENPAIADENEVGDAKHPADVTEDAEGDEAVETFKDSGSSNSDEPTENVGSVESSENSKSGEATESVERTESSETSGMEEDSESFEKEEISEHSDTGVDLSYSDNISGVEDDIDESYDHSDAAALLASISEGDFDDFDHNPDEHSSSDKAEQEGNSTDKKGFFSAVKDIFFESLDDEENEDDKEKEEKKKKKKEKKSKNKNKNKTEKNNTDSNKDNIISDVTDKNDLTSGESGDKNVNDVGDNIEIDVEPGIQIDSATSMETDTGSDAGNATEKTSEDDIEKITESNIETDVESEKDIDSNLKGEEPENNIGEDETESDKDKLLNLSDENERVIEELYGNKGDGEHLDDNEAPKKGFIAKLRYKLQQIKKKNEEEDLAEQEAERLELEEKQKKKEEKKAAAQEKKEQKKKEKEAKPKKEKKPKEKKEKKVKVKEPPKPGDILKIKPKSIILFVLFISGIVLLIQLANSAINYNMSISNAEKYFYEGKYDEAYNELSGMDIKEKDENIYNRVTTVMYIQRQYESFNNYMEMNMKPEALHALIKGIKRYDTYYNDAANYGVADEYNAIKDEIVKSLQNSFNMSEDEARTLSVMQENNFTQYYLKIQGYGGNNN